jgi:hypothetical protein
MDPAVWLEKTVAGFNLLSEPERAAIKDFALLWTVYEGTVLNASGNAGSIIKTVGSLKTDGKLSLEPVRLPIRYFIGRYFDGVELTSAFRELHLRRNDRPDLVENALRGKSNDGAEILAAILIIIFRQRKLVPVVSIS